MIGSSKSKNKITKLTKKIKIKTPTVVEETNSSIKRKSINDMANNVYKLEQREYRVHVTLPTSAIAEDLFDILKVFGKISQIAVPDGEGEELNRGFGFVTFKEKEAMEAAIEKTHFIDGEELVFSKSYEKEDIRRMKEMTGLLPPLTKKPKLRTDPKRMVFLAPVGHKTRQAVIEYELGTFGDVCNVHLPMRRNGIHNIGYANVIFNEQTGADKAIAAGVVEIDGVTVNIHPKKSDGFEEAPDVAPVPDEESTEEDGTTPHRRVKADHRQVLSIGPLTSTTTLEMLRTVYAKFGVITDVRKKTTTAKIVYESARSVREALQEGALVIDGQKVNSTTRDEFGDLNVSHFMPQNELFVGDLNFDWSKSEVHRYFTQFGPVKKFEFPVDKTIGCNKGYAIVVFKREADAIKVLRQPFPHEINKWAMKVVGREDYGDSGLVFRNKRKNAKRANKREDARMESEEMTRIEKEDLHRSKIAYLGIDSVDVEDLARSAECAVFCDEDEEDEDKDDDNETEEQIKPTKVTKKKNKLVTKKVKNDNVNGEQITPKETNKKKLVTKKKVNAIIKDKNNIDENEDKKPVSIIKKKQLPTKKSINANEINGNEIKAEPIKKIKKKTKKVVS